MIDYDSFSRCHLTDIFFRYSRGSKRVKLKNLFLLFIPLILVRDKIQTRKAPHIIHCPKSNVVFRGRETKMDEHAPHKIYPEIIFFDALENYFFY